MTLNMNQHSWFIAVHEYVKSLKDNTELLDRLASENGTKVQYYRSLPENQFFEVELSKFSERIAKLSSKTPFLLSK